MPFYHLALRARRPLARGYPQQPQKLGEHLKKRRLDLGLLQKDLATRLGTSVSNIFNWETNKTNPSFRSWPRIIRFLGYVPFETTRMTLGQQIRTCRRMLGLSQRELARRLGVHPDTVASWEKDKHRPINRQIERRLILFLSSSLLYRGCLHREERGTVDRRRVSRRYMR